MSRPSIMRTCIILAVALAFMGMAVASVSADVRDIIKMPPNYKFGTYTQKPWAGTTINVAMVSEPRNEAIQKLAPEFEKLTGIKVVFNILAYPTLQEKQMVALSQGSAAYDVVDVDCVWVGQYAGEGMTIPVEEFILRTDHNVLALDDFIPAVVSEQGMWQDRIYGLPCIQAVFGLYYRTDIFQKYNMKVPQTWDELRDTAQALHMKEPGVAGITFMGRRGVQLQCTYDNIIWSYGGEWFDKDNHSTINSKTAIDALDYFKSLIPYAPAGVLTYDWDENANAYAQGRAAMTIQWQNAAPTFYNPEKSKILGKFQFTLVPGVKQPDGSIKRTPTFGGWSLEIPKDSKNKEAAWEFIVWASSQKLDQPACVQPARLSKLGSREPRAAEEVHRV